MTIFILLGATKCGFNFRPVVCRFAVHFTLTNCYFCIIGTLNFDIGNPLLSAEYVKIMFVSIIVCDEVCTWNQ